MVIRKFILKAITTVMVRAHDLVDGFGGQVVWVELIEDNGLNFEVVR